MLGHPEGFGVHPWHAGKVEACAGLVWIGVHGRVVLGSILIALHVDSFCHFVVVDGLPDKW